MRRSPLLLALLVASSLVTACGKSGDTTTTTSTTEAIGDADQAAVRDIFLRYRDAIVTRKGKEAVGVVSTKTLGYFDAMRTGALHMSASELRAQPVMDRLMILLLRARIPKEELQGWTGKELFAVAVDNGWVGDNVQSIQPSTIEIQGNEARIGARAGGEELPSAMGFKAYREEGGWKLDVMSIGEIAQQALQEQLGQIDPDADRALLMLLSQLLQRKLDASIFEPIAPR
ncbi:hypothetical protein [Chondromyces crocatus]|uniref:Lipoprotein n=1 Tax=Chondromyces crocatus TaxID=52 RepID=A0A0K1EF69_CHOCO|nr:hypothetical protein [Chondromyces crocatus]AKT39511.1 uncharacterized protein CMC5_036580 [Chondromyces crocatus]